MQDIWWKNAVGYQIYIKSFADSNNDGIGDLKGIDEKLDYIKSLGVNFIWITPFYDSPMDDNGYDIRDYCKVDQSFGQMEDLKKLISKAHKKGIKVIIDLVLNHTSDENEWFIKSENKEGKYTDFYIWKDPVYKDGKRCPPNNWQSFFTGPAWKWSEKRQQYFLKIFSTKMPDINFENEFAFSSLLKVIDFYAKLKVDGFRVDAISHIGKDPMYRDGKKSKTYKRFSNLESTHRYLKRFGEKFAENNLVTMGELGGDPSKQDIIRYTTQGELDMVFSFEHTRCFKENGTIDAKCLYKALKFKQSIINKNGWSALFWLNHDYPRLPSKVYGTSDPKACQLALAALMYLQKGTPVVYNGEEIGMTNFPFTKISQFDDCNAKMMADNSDDKEGVLNFLKKGSRDNARTIMQWENAKNAGFSEKKPWFVVNPNYKKVNVKTEDSDSQSILNHYRRIFALREQLREEIISGKMTLFRKKNVIGYTIKANNTYMVVANLGESAVDMKNLDGEVLYSNVITQNNSLVPYEVRVIKK